MENEPRNLVQALGPDGYDPGVDFLVLGPVEVRRDADTVTLSRPKLRSTLALLVVNAGRPVSLDRIVDGIYGEDAADGARRSVQTYISMIRRELGDIVRRDAGGYVLTVDPKAIDAVRFEDMVRSALPMVDENPEGSAAMLQEALGMWRGHAFADVDGWGVFEPEITRLSELRLAALEARIDADLALGRHRELLGELDALTIEHPLRERFRAQQMLALYRCGRQTEALRAYERTRAYLADEIGIEPSPELQDLEMRVLEHDPTLELPAAPSLTQRALMAVEIADTATLMRLSPVERATLVEETTAILEAAATRHDGEGFGQRGTALYAAFPTVSDAMKATGEGMAATTAVGVRVAVDYGDVEVHETGEVAGPPVRRAAGLVAAAHAGQVLLSAGAHQALLADGDPGWVVRSLGSHPIHGIAEPQQVFQLMLDGQKTEFPPLLLDATPPALPTDRRAVAGYELRSPISSDLAGATYRAYQPSLGRQVQVTVIDPVWANQPEFVSRFEVETQLVARLHHPHVVPVLDYWRDPTGAYLVSPLVGGTTLAHVLYDGALGPDQGRRIVTQLGTALSHAHQVGVVHGAVSPDSVVLDDSGNAYLAAASFIVGMAGAPMAGSAYSAPERGPDQPIGAAGDIYSLGVLTRELLGDIAAEAVERATADDPHDRFGSVDDFLAEVANRLGEAGTVDTFTTTRNPYKGLDAFGETDAADFFGRADAVTDLTGMLDAHRLVAVVGPSGSGKSSLVKAGIIPAVRAGAVAGPSRWVVTDMFPGSYPFVELESALARVAVEDPGVVMDELNRNQQGLMRVLKRILPSDTGLLLVIDQFEELFTLTRDAETRDRFLAALVELAADERSAVRIIVTLRADFFDRPLQYPDFGDLLKAGMFALTIPAPAELAEAIARPAERVGIGWESDLVDHIVADVAGAPGSLPLLQYALTEIFESRQTDQLTHHDYRAAGGVLGALGTRADQVFEGLEPRHQNLARQLFLRLVTVQATGEQTRRRARLLDLNALSEPEDVNHVLSAFGDARLVTFDRDPITRGPTVEVAHEALLTRWSRLADWITEAREDLLILLRLEATAQEWEDSNQDSSYLIDGVRLEQATTWQRQSGFQAPHLVTDFIDASTQRDAQAKKERQKRRRFILGGFAAATVVALVLAVAAWILRGQAQESTARAELEADLAAARELVAEAERNTQTDSELSIHLALRAIKAFQAAGEVPGAAIDTLRRSIAADRVVDRFPGGEFVSVNHDGSTLVTRAGGGGIAVWDIQSQTPIKTIDDFGGWEVDYAEYFESTNELLVALVSESEGNARVLDLDTNVWSDLPGARGSIEDLGYLEISPNGDFVGVGAGDRVEVWDRRSGQRVFEAEAADAALALSNDGLLAFVPKYEGIAEPDFRIVDATTGQERQTVSNLSFVPLLAAFSPDGSQLAYIDGSSAGVVDVDSGQELWIRDDIGRTNRPVWLPEGNRFLTGGEGTLKLIGAANGDVIRQVEGNRGVTADYDRVPNTSWIASAGGNDGATLLIDLSGDGQPELNRFESPVSQPATARVSPAGETIFLRNQTEFALMDAQTGSVLTHYGLEDYHEVPGPTVASRNGAFIAGHAPATAYQVWSTVDGTEVSVVPGESIVRGVSSGGSLLAITGDTGTKVIRGLDMNSLRRDNLASTSPDVIATLDVGGPLYQAFFSADDRFVVTNNDLAEEPHFRIWEVESGSYLGDLGEFTGFRVEFTADDERLILGGEDGAITVFDFPKLRDGVPAEQAIVRQIPAHDTQIISVRVSPDNSMVASNAFDEPAKLWDLETGRALGEFGTTARTAMVFDPVRPWLYVSESGEVSVHTLDLDQLVAIAESRLTRDMTEDECELYLRQPCDP